MRILLQRLRANNLPFETAWDRAWKKVKWPHPTEHRIEWKATLEETQPVWRACYERKTVGGSEHWSVLSHLCVPDD